ncbi:uncharacterized protein C8R40DRAFT_1081795 [Lentinula edodes]|uniref:uncharacterized protein n=1 Tax=Lentinula edodes TaxID=5353 RepID=UPI001E8D49BA|nr:uncharacterized protein C8R40DRAFT_1081795 [Lentinula edodes]KAH7880768.1 hypothetical protein C8R40DRAFT_1081795 [Lentinula edodes]
MRLCLIPLCIGLFSIHAYAMLHFFFPCTFISSQDGSTIHARSGVLASQPLEHGGVIAKQDPSRDPTDRNQPIDKSSAQNIPGALVTITFEEEVHEQVPVPGERNATVENFVVSLLQRQYYTTGTLNSQTHIQWEHNVRSDWSLAQLLFRVEDTRTGQHCHKFCDAALDVHQSMQIYISAWRALGFIEIDEIVDRINRYAKTHRVVVYVEKNRPRTA